MRRRLSLLVVPALVTGGILVSHASAGADDNNAAVLVAAPRGGHSGDTVYLTGAHFAPRQRFYLMMACPNWHDDTVAQYQNIKFQKDGPTTDAHGGFRAFPYQVLTLHHFKGLGCTIYTSDGLNAFGPNFPALYTIYPPDQPLPECLKRLCVSFKTIPQRVKSGSVETVHLQSWAGAGADVAVSYPGATTQHQKVDINLNGDGWAQFRIGAIAGTQPVPAQVQVLAHIGAQKRMRSGQFIIVR